MSSPLIVADAVSKVYTRAAGAFTAVDAVSLTIDRGEFAAILGQSGSGKSTLLGLLAGIDRPTAGRITVGDTRIDALSERELSVWRGNSVGIVFQFFQLLPTLTAAENVMLPMDFCDRWPTRDRRPRAVALLERLGVADQADKLPSTLSGGQQQRVAIARALANAPAVLLADEPTGNLDSKTGGQMFELFASLAAEGQTVVLVTHEREALRWATSVTTLADGRIVAAEAIHA